MARRVSLLLVCLELAWLAIASGCGYSTGSLVDRRMRRVYLPMFHNQTYYRDFEVELTRQVEREIASRPGIFIVPRDQADIVLTGTIVDFRLRVLSEDDRDRVRESSATTTVRISIEDARSGRVLKSYEVSDRAEFFLARGENQATATAESFFDLARKIVQGLEQEFPRSSRTPRDRVAEDSTDA